MEYYNTNELIIPHPGLKPALQLLLKQVEISIPYCRNKFGTNNSLTDIWNIGKQNLIYKSDHLEIEQFQSVGTLFENNIHGIPGAGDCDCFTIFTLAMIYASPGSAKNQNINIYLQGNKKSNPSHILTMIGNNSDQFYIDFTNKNINEIRKYKYFDYIKINQL